MNFYFFSVVFCQSIIFIRCGFVSFPLSGGYLIFSFFDRLIKNDFSIIKAEPNCIFINKTAATTEQQQHCVHIMHITKAKLNT